jgi:hypothetical protein
MPDLAEVAMGWAAGEEKTKTPHRPGDVRRYIHVALADQQVSRLRV